MSTQSNHSLLRKQISTLAGFQQFREYIEREYSVENLLFIQACDEYQEVCKTSKSSKVKWQGAVHLWKRYIHEDGEYQVNLPGSLSEKIVQRIAKLAPFFDKKNKQELPDVIEGEEVSKIFRKMFRKSRKEIFNLVATDTFPRFLKSLETTNSSSVPVRS
eukprot:214468_1